MAKHFNDPVYGSGLYINPIALAAAFAPVVLVIVLFLLFVYAPGFVLGVLLMALLGIILYSLFMLGVSIYEEVDGGY